MNIRYEYENLHELDFENLVVSVCQDLLFGIGCKTFSPGKDGGKDSWFHGTAENFPSKESPWSGITIIQAKHTKSLEESCSDNGFFGNKTSIMALELERLSNKKLAGENFDNYIIFTNRKLTGIAHPKLRESINNTLKITNSDVIGREQLDVYIGKLPDLIKKYKLHRFSLPERFYENDIRNIIYIFSNTAELYNDRSEIQQELINISKETKNALNNLSEEYFDFIKTHSLPYFNDINDFLKSPINVQYMNMYRNTTSDLQAFILNNTDRFGNFMEIIEHIVNSIVDNDETMLHNRRLARVFVHFMYFNCDIGRKE